MGVTVSSLVTESVSLVRKVDSRSATVARVPSGKGSISYEFIRPAVKAGTPSDADYGTSLPPVGTIVIDTTGVRLWVRVAAGTWRSTLLS